MLRYRFLVGLAFALSTIWFVSTTFADTNVETEKSATAPEGGTDAKLTIGSPAPELDVEHWVQDGEGRFQPVTSFEEGKVYVIEFWATWCGPCILSMPFISELQSKYADQGLQIVSISREPLETVTNFLQREARDFADEEGNPITYAELTKGYCLTTDPDRSSTNDYMKVSGRNGIPCAFLVGKDGLIEWIGHPMLLDEPLDQVINDSWDREAFALSLKFQDRMEQLKSLLLQAGFDEGMAKVDELVAEAPTPELAEKAEDLRLIVYTNRFLSLSKTDSAAALELLPELLAMAQGDARFLYQLTRAAVRDRDVEADSPVLTELIARVQLLHESDQKDVRSAVALSAIKRKQGDLMQAVEYCEEAMELADNRIQKRAFKMLADQMRKQLESSQQESSEETEPTGRS